MDNNYIPPENIRNIIKDHGDMSSRTYNNDKRIYLSALQFLHHAIYKLLENMSWEHITYIDVMYHVTGALTFVTEIPRVIEPVYTAQWWAMWISMREEKANKQTFTRIPLPVYDDEEQPLDYWNTLLPLEPLEWIKLKLDEQEDYSVIDWFYERKPLQYSKQMNRQSYKKWKFTTIIYIVLMSRKIIRWNKW